MSKSNMVKREVLVPKFNLCGEDYKMGAEVELSQQNAEIFKDKLGEVGTIANRKQRSSANTEKLKKIMEENKTLGEENAKLKADLAQAEAKINALSRPA